VKEANLTVGAPAERAANPGSANCLPLGTRIKQFQILSVVGEGGFGIVYRAFDESLQRDVALKEYMPGALASRHADASVQVRAPQHEVTFKAGFESFIKEAHLLARFNHPAMVSVYYFLEENGTAYMAMPFYDGQNLRQAVTANPSIVSEEWIMQLLAPILDVLESLHAMSCFHRDIAPDNILLQPNGNPILLDFGAARRVIGDMNQAMTVILKPGFAPIEQYVDDGTLPQGAWTDIYALSAVLYSLIQGKAPTPSVVRMVNDPMKPLSGSRDDYSPGLLLAIDRGLAVKPESRPQSIAEFRDLLNLPARTIQQTRLRGLARQHRDDEKTVIVPRNAIDVSIGESAAEQSAVSPGIDTLPGTQMPLVPQHIKSKLLPVALSFVLSLVVLLGVVWWFKSAREPAIRLAENSAVKSQAPKPPLPATSSLEAKSADADAVKAVAQQTSDATGAKVELAPSSVNPAATRDGVSAAVAIRDQKKESTPAETQSSAESKVDVVAKPGVPAHVVPGAVALFIRPWGEILVNGKPRGTSPPIKQLSLAPGSYSIEVRNPGFPAFKHQIVVKSKETAVVRYQFQ
jgi:serine/threonine protein kinase